MLKPINKKPLVNYVYDKCLKGKYFKKVIVATCDNLIKKKVEEAGGEAVLTSHLHKGCISRIAEAVLKNKKIKLNDYICIVQGDEVLVDNKILNSLCKFIINNYKKINVINVLSKIKNHDEYKLLSVIKAIIGKNKNIIYMARTLITHSIKKFNKNISKNVFRQTGIIALKKRELIKYYKLKRTFFEKKESIDMLRFIENDIDIKSFIISRTMIGIDTEQDYINFIKRK